MDHVAISLYDYMDQLESDLAPEISENLSLSGCASFELTTQRYAEGRTFVPEDEVLQRLTIATDGTVRLRANTYHNGPRSLGIGRILDTTIPTTSVQEICRLLDTWLYMHESADWDQTHDNGQWYLRVRSADGKERIHRGPLDGAFLDGIDISWFMRQRIPIPQIYLFDQSL